VENYSSVACKTTTRHVFRSGGRISTVVSRCYPTILRRLCAGFPGLTLPQRVFTHVETRLSWSPPKRILFFCAILSLGPPCLGRLSFHFYPILEAHSDHFLLKFDFAHSVLCLCQDLTRTAQPSHPAVIPAKAGIYRGGKWIPAYAGMTAYGCSRLFDCRSWVRMLEKSRSFCTAHANIQSGMCKVELKLVPWKEIQWNCFR
jgi:hypothetical protein